MTDEHLEMDMQAAVVLKVIGERLQEILTQRAREIARDERRHSVTAKDVERAWDEVRKEIAVD